VRRRADSDARVLNASSVVAVRVNQPAAAAVVVAEADRDAAAVRVTFVWTRTYEPGLSSTCPTGNVYQKPAPNRLQPSRIRRLAFRDRIGGLRPRHRDEDPPAEHQEKALIIRI